MGTPSEIISFFENWLEKDHAEAKSWTLTRGDYRSAVSRAKAEHSVLVEARKTLEATVAFRGQLATHINAEIAKQLYIVRRCKMLESLHYEKTSDNGDEDAA